MSKNRLVIGGFVVGFILVVGGILWFRGVENTPISPEGERGELLGIPEVKEVEEILYEDAAGFSFNYPENLVVEDKTEEAGEEYYTLLEVKANQGDRGNKGNQGALIRLEIRDTKFETVEEWLEKAEEAPTGAKLAGAVGLDEISAKQYTKDKKIWTVAIDLGALYIVEGSKDPSASSGQANGLWEETYNRLIETFALAETEPEQKTAGSSSSGASAGGNVIYETEEVIE